MFVTIQWRYNVCSKKKFTVIFHYVSSILVTLKPKSLLGVSQRMFTLSSNWKANHKRCDLQSNPNLEIEILFKKFQNLESLSDKKFNPLRFIIGKLA